MKKEEELTNINIEKIVLNAIIFAPENYELVNIKLKSKDFNLKAHRDIYIAMQELEKEDKPIDEEFIIDKLKTKKAFKEDVFIEVLAVNPITAIKPYIEELKHLSLKRELLELANEIRRNSLEEDMPATDIANNTEAKIYEITSQSKETGDFKNANEASLVTLEFIKKRKENANRILVGTDTGFNELNQMTTGFGEGELIILAGRPSMGKTALALNMVLNLIDKKEGVAFFSLEMPCEQLMLRLLSIKTSIPLQRLRIGDMDDDEFSRLNDGANELSSSSLFIYDSGNLNISLLRSKLRKLKSKNPNINIAIIDYLQIMSSISSKERHLEVSEISRGLKLLARELKISILALSQLNRALESRNDKRPMLSDIRESGSIEQDADIVLFVYRDDVYLYKEEKEREKQAKKEGKEFKAQYIEKPEEEAEIIIAKQRNGPTGHIKLTFQKRFTRFIDPKKEELVIKYENIDIKETKNNEETQIDMPEF